MQKAPPQTIHQLTPSAISEIIEMALSDHIAFQMINHQHGIAPDQVKELMRRELKSGSYRAWRKRVRDFGDRRENYKRVLPASVQLDGEPD